MTAATQLDVDIGNVLRKFPEVSAAWLFGSMARGTPRPDSDLDVALLFRGRGTTVARVHELVGRIAAHLEAVAPGRRVDLVSIETQGPVFQHRVLSEGRLVLDVGAATRFAPIVGFRNRILHLYDRVDPQLVYRILTENRADLADLARLLATALPTD